MQRLHVIVTGEVQGVGFRWFVQRAARALDVHGEVRNRGDGAVVIEAEGDRAPLERLAEAARQGPAGAVVAAVDERWTEGPARYRDFTIGASA